MDDTLTATDTLWSSIAAVLEGEIARGHYPPGARLPTESALAARFGVHRHTLRRALADLGARGLVRSRRGAGVFVSGGATEYRLGTRVRFHANLIEAGLNPEKRVLRAETRASDAEEAGALRLAPGAVVHVYEGLSLGDGTPLALFQSVFPAARFPGLRARLDGGGSVTAALAAEGLADYTRAVTRLTAMAAGATQAGLLGLAPGAPVLRTVAVNVDAGGRPVEYGRTWFAGDRITLVVGDDG